MTSRQRVRPSPSPPNSVGQQATISGTHGHESPGQATDGAGPIAQADHVLQRTLRFVLNRFEIRSQPREKST